MSQFSGLEAYLKVFDVDCELSLQHTFFSTHEHLPQFHSHSYSKIWSIHVYLNYMFSFTC